MHLIWSLWKQDHKKCLHLGGTTGKLRSFSIFLTCLRKKLKSSEASDSFRTRFEKSSDTMPSSSWDGQQVRVKSPECNLAHVHTCETINLPAPGQNWKSKARFCSSFPKVSIHNAITSLISSIFPKKRVVWDRSPFFQFFRISHILSWRSYWDSLYLGQPRYVLCRESSIKEPLTSHRTHDVSLRPWHHLGFYLRRQTAFLSSPCAASRHYEGFALRTG